MGPREAMAAIEALLAVKRSDVLAVPVTEGVLTYLVAIGHARVGAVERALALRRAAAPAPPQCERRL